MKILIVSQHYYPESFRVTSLAESLVKRGHDVTVLTGIPNYPKGEYYPGYSKKTHRDETLNGVHIIRASESPRKTGVIRRAINYYSFANSAKKIAKKLPGDFDVVLAWTTSPIMMAEPALTYKKKWGVPVLMYEMDLWPESLLAGGIKKGSLIYNHYQRVSSRIYSKMDKILVSSKQHIGYIKSLLNQDVPFGWLPQYADDEGAPLETKENSGIHRFLFAGNIGMAQSCDTIIEAAHLLKEYPYIEFLFAGDGSEAHHLKNLVQEKSISNVKFLGQIPKNEMGAIYASSDAAFVSLTKQGFCFTTIPGKVQTYMKVGLPIINCAEGATAEFIEEANCGINVPGENPKALSEAILHFVALSSDKRREMAENGKHFYNEFLTEEKHLDCIESEMKKLVAKKTI